MADHRGQSRIKWEAIWLVEIYRLARLGVSYTDIAASLGVNRKQLERWQKKRAGVAEALEMARRERDEGASLPDYIYRQLSPALQELWNKIQMFDENGPSSSAVSSIELLLQDHGKRARQQLFLYALVESKFSPSEAMRKVNVPKRQLDRWVKEDAEFAEMVEEIEYHKANFFESALVSLVAQGNPAAVIFANKSFNHGRGYGVKNTLEVSGSVLHGVLDLSEIMGELSPSAKLEVLEAIRKREKVEQTRQSPQTLTSTEMISHSIAEVVDG